VTAVIEALAHAGVWNNDSPVMPDKVWEALNEVGFAG
jgi:CO/xanthine dehydrogenase Mo-binding subunit